MSILHAKCEKEIAELKQQHNNDKSNIKELNAKLKKGNKELAAFKKEATSLNEKLENLEYDLEKQNILKEDIVKLKEDIVNQEKQLENYSKTIEKIANIISPTDYKIIETISNYTQVIESERLPELVVSLEIQESGGQLTMQAINGFINQLSGVFLNVIVDIELEGISTNGPKTSLKFRTKYRSSYEDITSGIVAFCATHFYVKRWSERVVDYVYDEARKPIIVKSSKKDRLLELNLVPIS